MGFRTSFNTLEDVVKVVQNVVEYVRGRGKWGSERHLIRWWTW